MIVGFATALNTTPDAVLYDYSYTNLILYARNLVNEASDDDTTTDTKTNQPQMSDEDILLL